MTNLQDLVEEYAGDSNFSRNVGKILKFDRGAGDNPILLLDDAAGKRGQYYLCGEPSPELQFNESGVSVLQCGHVFDATPWIECGDTSRHA